eukprot:scaffold117891_cov34-Tisochrysis_lutea.AAC.2
MTVWSSITPRRRHSSRSNDETALPRMSSTTFGPARMAMTSPSRSDLFTTSNHPDVGGNPAIPSSFA